MIRIILNGDVGYCDDEYHADDDTKGTKRYKHFYYYFN